MPYGVAGRTLDVCFSAEDVVEPMPLRTVQELEASFFGRFTAALDEYDSLDPALPAVAADVVAGVTPEKQPSSQARSAARPRSMERSSTAPIDRIESSDDGSEEESVSAIWEAVGGVAGDSGAEPVYEIGGDTEDSGTARETKSKPAPVNTSMITKPASMLRREATGRAPHSFGSVPRFSPSGTMAHHGGPKVLPLAAAKPKRAPQTSAASTGGRPQSAGAAATTRLAKDDGEQPQPQTARPVRGDVTTCVDCVPDSQTRERPPTATEREPYSSLTNRYEPRPFGASALGVHQFRHRPTKPRRAAPVKAHAASAGGVSVGRAADAAPDEAAVFDWFECCGPPFEGYCCKRHHPDDDVICCKRHQRAAELHEPARCHTRLTATGEWRQVSPATAGGIKAWPSTIGGPTFTFGKAGAKGPFRETAVAQVPKGHRQHPHEPGRSETLPRWR